MTKFPAGKDVFADLQIGERQQLLMDDRNPMRRSIARRAQRDRPALEKQRAFIRLFRARQNAHQRGLARAVLSDEHIHLPAVRAEGDAIERDIARIALGDVARFQNDFCGGLIRLAHATRSAVSRARSTASRHAPRRRSRSACDFFGSNGCTLLGSAASSSSERHQPRARPPSKRRAARREILLRRAMHGPAKNVGLHLHQRIVARSAAVGEQNRQCHARGALHGFQNVGDLEGNGVDRGAGQMRGGVRALDIGHQAARSRVPIRRAEPDHRRHQNQSGGVGDGCGQRRGVFNRMRKAEKFAHPLHRRAAHGDVAFERKVRAARRSTTRRFAPAVSLPSRAPA